MDRDKSASDEAGRLAAAAPGQTDKLARSGDEQLLLRWAMASASQPVAAWLSEAGLGSEELARQAEADQAGIESLRLRLEIARQASPEDLHALIRSSLIARLLTLSSMTDLERGLKILDKLQLMASASRQEEPAPHRDRLEAMSLREVTEEAWQLLKELGRPLPPLPQVLSALPGPHSPEDDDAV